MAIHIQSGKKNLQTEETKANVQYMPFKIHADSDTNVQKYFNNFVKKGDDDGKKFNNILIDINEVYILLVLSSSFRGYPLKGRVINVPEDYVGVVFHETCRPSTKKDERKFFPIHKFDKFINWNWDKIPSKNDTISQAIDWIDIAEAVSILLVKCL